MNQKQTSASYPLLPLRGMLVFPHMVTPLEVGRARSIQALEKAMLGDQRIVVAAQLDTAVEEPGPEDIYTFGTVCQIKQLLKMPEGQTRILVEGLERVELVEFDDSDDFFLVSIQEWPSIERELDSEAEALMRSSLQKFEDYVKLGRKIPSEVLANVSGIKDPEQLVDTIAGQLALAVEERQPLLEIRSVKERYIKLLALLTKELEILKLEKKIQGKVRKQMERAQKEYYLREQIKAIQSELGEKEDRSTEVDEYRKKLSETKIPKAVREKAENELNRFERMPPMAAESVVVRSYLDWLLALPWNRRTKDRLDIQMAETILERDHYGLAKVKERILEFLAVRQLTKTMKGPILCLVGPPGVGKTSLAKSVAEALKRNFVRLSLGGVRDEAEIRGHRRTYVGALPGKIIQSMKTAGSNNPVILFDEVDKLANDFRGDPSSALLEVLDPEQNNAFVDHYIELPFDLSRVLFITTANVLNTVPPALRDRMEVIEIPGYTEHEKLEIAKRHLWRKQVEAHGLAWEQISISDNALLRIINEYTREAGVRNLERELAAICRKSAADVVKGDKDQIRVSANMLERFLGIPRYHYAVAEREDRVGVATGLAYTQFGGDILSIEVTIVKGKGKLTLTGKLGDVMQESAQTAVSYVRSRAEALGIDPDFHEKHDIHMHVPEGAVPKDGPSAGITIAVALVSALANIPVRQGLAMTGEITLRGRVLGIGGLKEKLLAAHRAGLKQILIPEENRKDLEEVPENVRRKLEIFQVDHMDHVLRLALLKDPNLGSDMSVLADSELAKHTDPLWEKHQ